MRYYLKTNARYCAENGEVYTTVELDSFVHEALESINQTLDTIDEKEEDTKEE